jgi:toxin ParE1/3/4
MPYRVELTAQAKRDLDLIYRYIEAEESQLAATWFNRLHTALQSLAEMPERSPLIHEGRNPRHLNLRHLLYGDKPHVYRVIYRIRENYGTVTVLTIRHGARSPLRNNNP